MGDIFGGNAFRSVSSWADLVAGTPFFRRPGHSTLARGARSRADRGLRLRRDQPADAHHFRSGRTRCCPRTLRPRHRRALLRPSLGDAPTIRRVETTDRHLRLLTETIRAGQLHASTSRRCCTSSPTRSPPRSRPTHAWSTCTTMLPPASFVLRATARHAARRDDAGAPACVPRSNPPAPRRPSAVPSPSPRTPTSTRAGGRAQTCRSRVRVDPRRPILAREERKTSTTREPREFRSEGIELLQDNRGPGEPVDRPRTALRRGAAAGRRARGARPHLRGRVRVPLPRGVARGDRQDDDGRGPCDGRGAGARGRQESPGRKSHASTYAVRTPLRWKRRRSRASPTATHLLRQRARAARSDRPPPAVALDRPGGDARRARPGDPPPRQGQLQTVASLLRLQARAEGINPREALEHSVNRILAIAAVHEVLTEQRERTSSWRN